MFKIIFYISIYDSTDSRLILKRLRRLCKNSVQPFFSERDVNVIGLN